MSAAAGLPCTPHSANLSLVTLCTMHLLGAIPNAGKYLELSIEGPDCYPWQQHLFLGDPYAVEEQRHQTADLKFGRLAELRLHPVHWRWGQLFLPTVRRS